MHFVDDAEVLVCVPDDARVGDGGSGVRGHGDGYFEEEGVEAVESGAFLEVEAVEGVVLSDAALVLKHVRSKGQYHATTFNQNLHLFL